MLRLNADYSRIYLILALCSAWIADTGAYFTGTFFGKHRLCPEVSPKKSVEGFVGGIVLNLVVEELVYILLLNQSHSVKDAVLFGITALLAGAIGTLGDLTASLIKRQTGIKDFGNIMPGHGGALDRFDSVLMVVPFFYIAVSSFGL